jgi:hypothetical protein
MKTARTLLNRFRAWRLNRWADQLLKDAAWHEREARFHRSAASQFSLKSSDVRALARRIEAAGQI